jgi:hypothetical protein
LVGPGLVLALALLATGLKAETPAGLDAQGVDPRAAVDNKLGLDIRDELGRPVTAQKVLSDMKAVAAAKAGRNAYASALPKAQAILSALELLASAAAAFRVAAEGFQVPELLPGLPGSGPRLELILILLLACAATTSALCCRASAQRVLCRSRQSRPEVLRC